MKLLWMFCTFFSILHADTENEHQDNACGRLNLITPHCKESDVILRFTPTTGLILKDVYWTLNHFDDSNNDKWKAQNTTGLSIFANDSGHFIVWKTREKMRNVVDFTLRIGSEPSCSFKYTRITYRDFKMCKENIKPTEKETTVTQTLLTTNESKGRLATESYTVGLVVPVTSSVKHTRGMVSVTNPTYPMEKGTPGTDEMHSEMNNVNREENENTDSSVDGKTENIEATIRVESHEETNTLETKNKNGLDPQNTFGQWTVATMKAYTVERNGSNTLTVILVILGGLLCVVIIAIAILVYRKKKGKMSQDENGDDNLQDAQRERSARNGYEFDSQDTPEVLYAQVEKKPKTLQNASLVAQVQINETDRRDVNEQPTELVRKKLTFASKEEEEEKVPNNEDTKQELVYIQLDMEHLNKSSTPQKKSAERNDEDKTEYVGIDFAKTSQIKAN